MDKIIIKRYNRNDYLLTDNGYWVRDYTKISNPIDINSLIDESDYRLFVENQITNRTNYLANIDAETIYAPNVVIISDGYQYEDKQQLLSKLSKKVIFIGTNHSLARRKENTRLDYFIVNNPYGECISYLPKTNYYPKCVTSCRTLPLFIEKYKRRKGVMYQYTPTPDKKFGAYTESQSYYVDDYRNPVCAAISLAFHWQAQKILLFCCDDSFKDERPAAEQLENGLWTYPQQRISHGLIDGMLYWFKNSNKEMVIRSHSSGADYKYAPYISSDELLRFF